MRERTAGLAAWGVAASDIHTEIFGSGPSRTPGISEAPLRKPHLPVRSTGAGPLISFTRSSLDVRWAPACRSVRELAEACDIPVRWSYRTCVCHTCTIGLVAGRVTYRPHPSAAPEYVDVLLFSVQTQGDVANH